MTPVAYVQSPFKQRLLIPRQPGLSPTRSVIEFTSDALPPGELVSDTLDGIEGFSHLWIIFWFHQNPPGSVSAKVRPPRLKGHRVGVYAARSPNRPNAIGISCVKLVRRSGPAQLEVEGADLLDGTPVFDVKPYVAADRVDRPVHGWIDHHPEEGLRVEFSPAVAAVLSGDTRLEKELRAIIAQDPRDSYQRGRSNMRVWKAFFGDWNVVWRVEEGVAVVDELQPRLGAERRRAAVDGDPGAGTAVASLSADDGGGEASSEGP